MASDTAFTKLFASIIHSTVWREPDHVRLVWVTMLAMADSEGYVGASLPGLADAARVTLEQCQEALERFQSVDPHSRSQEHEGRRIETAERGWRLLNHAAFRAKVSADAERERKRLWWQENRSKKRLAKTSETSGTRHKAEGRRQKAEGRRQKQRSGTERVNAKDLSGSARATESAAGNSRTPPRHPIARPDSAPDESLPDGGDTDPVQGSKASQRPPDGPPRNLEQALAIPIAERSQQVVESPHVVDWVQPGKWPEVLDLARRFSSALDWHQPRFGRGGRAPMRMVELLAVFTPDELDSAILAAPSDEWLTTGTKGLSALTVDVVGQLLNGRRAPTRGNIGVAERLIAKGRARDAELAAKAEKENTQ